MAKQLDYALYICDRCGSQEYVPAGVSTAARWFDIQRIDQRLQQRPYLFDAKCYNEWLKLATRQDTEFTTFMENKPTTTTTTEETK